MKTKTETSSETDQLYAAATIPADAVIQGGGSIYLFTPVTQAARDWLEEHCSPDGEHQYIGHSLAVEHRYIGDIVALAEQDGLVIR